MASPAEIVRAALVQMGIAADDGIWQATVDELPAGKTDQAVCVMDTGAVQGRRSMRGNRDVHPTIGVLVRSRSYPEGWAKCEEVVDLFDRIGTRPESGGVGTVGVYLEDFYYQLTGVTVTVTPVKISEEETNRRSVFILNARIKPPLVGVPLGVIWGTYHKTWGLAVYPWNGVARLPVGVETAAEFWNESAYDWEDSPTPWGG